MTPTATQPVVAASPRPPAGHWWRRGILVVAAAVLLVAAVTVGWRVLRSGGTTAQAACTTTDGVARFGRPAAQVAKAADLAAVGLRLGLPDHAITVVLAAAMQESGLRNLPGGDRDSVGLLQQRPSQGWGTRTQLLDPSYAATAFYRRLQQVPSWETLDVTAAAQAVQRSARPDAYRQWEPEARAMAKAFTGESGAALSCQGGRPSRALSATRVASMEAAALGRPGIGQTVAPAHGWATTTWLVTHAGDLGVATVTFAGQAWNAGGGGWKPAPPARPVVTFTSS